MVARRDVALHALEVLAAALVGWLLTTKHPATALAPAAVLATSLLGQYFSAKSQMIRDLEERLNSFLALVPLEGNVRATLHVPIWRGRYRQLTDYVPTGRGAGKGRKFGNREGIVGECMRAKDGIERVDNFTSEGDYRKEAGEKYGLPVEKLQRRQIDRRSFLAKPIMSDRQCLKAVLYFDSRVPQTFPVTGARDIDTILSGLADELGMMLRR